MYRGTASQGGESKMAKKVAKTVKAPTKTEIMNNIAEATGQSKKDVAAFFEANSQKTLKDESFSHV